jgi:VanZ family protein
MLKSLPRKLNLWAPPILWALLIFYLSSRSLPTASEFYWKDFVFKKSAHILFYGFLAILVYRALVGEGTPKKKALVLAFIVAVIYGITDEIHQSFTPGRESRVRDVFFDSFGAFLTTFTLSRSGTKYKKLLSHFGLY